MMLASPFLRRMLPRNRFVRNVSVLVGGTAGAQAAAVLAAPLLTRLYTPQDFGLLAVFAALLSLISVIAGLRYETAIPLPEDGAEAAALAALGLLCVALVSALSAIPIFLYGTEIAAWLNTPRLADYFYLVPLGALLAGCYSVLNFCAIRSREFGPLAKTKLGQSAIAVLIQLAGAPFGALALLLGQMAGQGAGAVSLAARVLRPRRSRLRAIGWRSLAQAARRYRQFPLFATWGALFNTAGSQLPAVLFAALFGPAAAGLYILANRVLAMPMQLLGQAIGNVFVSDAAVARREGRLARLTADIHYRLAQIGMPPMVVLLAAGPQLFALVFGEQWRAAGVYAQWLAPWLYLVFVTSPLSSLFAVLERQAAGMLFQGLLLSVRVAAIAFGAWAGDVMTAVAWFATGSALCWFACLAWLVRASGNAWRVVWQPTVGALAWAAALASPLIAGAAWPMGRAQWVLFAAATVLLIAARYAFLMRRAWR
ncbi:MAG TPA: oligosaccharide flippase family protein [Paucimonas sp.]|nr:oligosaccharide flippase family protein [Paucimonas sp.]